MGSYFVISKSAFQKFRFTKISFTKFWLSKFRFSKFRNFIILFFKIVIFKILILKNQKNIACTNFKNDPIIIFVLIEINNLKKKFLQLSIIKIRIILKSQISKTFFTYDHYKIARANLKKHPLIILLLIFLIFLIF